MSAGSDPIEVVPSGQTRVELFAIAEPSSGSLAPFVLEIDHIGSTAVPGLAAKPVIDIPVGVRTLDDSAKIVSAVGSLGYEYVPEFEDQRRIAATSGGASTAAVAIKIHFVERSNSDWWNPMSGSGLASQPRRRSGSVCRTQAEPCRHPSGRDDRRAYTDA